MTREELEILRANMVRAKDEWYGFKPNSLNDDIINRRMQEKYTDTRVIYELALKKYVEQNP